MNDPISFKFQANETARIIDVCSFPSSLKNFFRFQNFASMGRGNLSLKLIPNLKSRRSTFKQRKNSLLKKAYELSTLCDVRTCVLIHGPGSAPGEDQSQQSDAAFHFWPPNRSEIEGMIRAYKGNSGAQKRPKSFDLYEFFSHRKRKIETETCKLRENVEEILCPKWDERLDDLPEDQLRAFMDGLDSKIEAASGMIDAMEADYGDLFRELAFAESCSNTPEMALDVTPGLFIVPDGDELGFNLEDLQSLFREDDYNSNMEFGQYRNLLNDEFEYGNNLEHLMTAANW